MSDSKYPAALVLLVAKKIAMTRYDIETEERWVEVNGSSTLLKPKLRAQAIAVLDALGFERHEFIQLDAESRMPPALRDQWDLAMMHGLAPDQAAQQYPVLHRWMETQKQTEWKASWPEPPTEIIEAVGEGTEEFPLGAWVTIQHPSGQQVSGFVANVAGEQLSDGEEDYDALVLALENVEGLPETRGDYIIGGTPAPWKKVTSA